MSRTLVIDNGSYTLKVGYSSPESVTPLVIPNSIARSRDKRTFVGSQLDDCRDYSGMVFRRPNEKGQIVNWECQKALWDYTFYNDATKLKVDPLDTKLVLTETPFTLPTLSANTDQVVFEEYGFESFIRKPASGYVPWNNIANLYEDKPPTKSKPKAKTIPSLYNFALIVDSGFSATTVTPVINGEVQWGSIKRLNIGGNILTNYLRETISFRYYNVMEETYLINTIKEKCCFVSTKFNEDLDIAHNISKKINPLRIDYLLPDFNTTVKGHIVEKNKDNTISKDSEDSQTLSLLEERFTVPDILFHPSDIGLFQCGIPEMIIKCLETVPEQYKPLVLANVVLIGGNTKIPNYSERIAQDLRSLAPANYTVRVGTPEDPITYAWHGANNFAQSPSFESKILTRDEYFENGSSYCHKKFAYKIASAFDHYDDDLEDEDMNEEMIMRGEVRHVDDDVDIGKELWEDE